MPPTWPWDGQPRGSVPVSWSVKGDDRRRQAAERQLMRTKSITSIRETGRGLQSAVSSTSTGRPAPRNADPHSPLHARSIYPGIPSAPRPFPTHRRAAAQATRTPKTGLKRQRSAASLKGGCPPRGRGSPGALQAHTPTLLQAALPRLPAVFSEEPALARGRPASFLRNQGLAAVGPGPFLRRGLAGSWHLCLPPGLASDPAQGRLRGQGCGPGTPERPTVVTWDT